MAQAIADEIKAPLFETTSTSPSALNEFDILIFGNPVEGASPAKEAVAFIESMPAVTGKKAIVFCTNRLFGAGRTLGIMEKMLEGKGYEVVLRVSKKGMKPDKEADFSEILEEVKRTVTK